MHIFFFTSTFICQQVPLGKVRLQNLWWKQKIIFYWLYFTAFCCSALQGRQNQNEQVACILGSGWIHIYANGMCF